MNSKKNTIILIIVFVGLMIGTSALYNSLSEKYIEIKDYINKVIGIPIQLRFRIHAIQPMQPKNPAASCVRNMNTL